MVANTLKRGFEVYYFDGLGNRQGPIDFEEMMELMGVLDAEERAVSDDTLYEQFALPFSNTLRTEIEEGSVSDRVIEEPESAGTGDPFAEGVRE